MRMTPERAQVVVRDFVVGVTEASKATEVIVALATRVQTLEDRVKFLEAHTLPGATK